jgi:hypothetical protein
MATLVTTNWDPVIRSCYLRLRAAGGLGRLYAEAADDSHRDDDASDTMATTFSSEGLPFRQLLPSSRFHPLPGHPVRVASCNGSNLQWVQRNATPQFRSEPS